MEIEVIYPQNQVIQQYIDYYYIFNPSRQNLQEYYTAYPHINTPVFFYNNFLLTREASTLCYIEAAIPKFEVGVIGRSEKAFRCVSNGCIYAVTIVFKPLGLNHFIKKTFEETAPDLFQPFAEWKKYQGLLEPLLKEPNKNKLRTQLDTFLLSLYRPIDDSGIEKAIQLMCDPEKHCELNEIQKIISVSRKTLFRLFKKHTGISPTSFRRIARFRKALALQKKKDEKLTQLAYEAHFSDQAHFTNDIKKITGGAPKKLFKETVYVSDSPFLIKLNK